MSNVDRNLQSVSYGAVLCTERSYGQLEIQKKKNVFEILKYDCDEKGKTLV